MTSGGENQLIMIIHLVIYGTWSGHAKIQEVSRSSEAIGLGGLSAHKKHIFLFRSFSNLILNLFSNFRSHVTQSHIHIRSGKKTFVGQGSFHLTDVTV